MSFVRDLRVAAHSLVRTPGLAIALVGVAGVLAFSVSARTREFGIRLALGSEPQRLLKGVIAEGAVMAAAGVLAGAAFGFVLARLAGRYFLDVKMPGALPVFVSAFVLMTVAVFASVLRASMLWKRCAPSDGWSGRCLASTSRYMHRLAAAIHQIRTSLNSARRALGISATRRHGAKQ